MEKPRILVCFALFRQAFILDCATGAMIGALH